MNRRIVITGMGALTPIGNNVKSFWRALKIGKNGINNITKFDISNYSVKLAAELKDFDDSKNLSQNEIKRLDPVSRYALNASIEAIKDSGLNMDSIDKYRLGVIVSSGIGGLSTIQNQVGYLHNFGPRKVSPLFIPMSIVNMAAANIAIKFQAKGMCTSIVTACSTATNCIGEAARAIRHNYADVIISGGSEASITEIGIAGFTSNRALSRSNDPNRASIPFDKERNGFVMGEGSGILVLESLEHALARNANIYAELVGYASTCDAYHITSPIPSGEGAVKALLSVLLDANIKPHDVSYINAHGTSTPLNDSVETKAIKEVFASYAYDIPISSTKSMTGHLLGGAGAIEAIATILSLKNDFVHPTINYQVFDHNCDLNYVPNIGINKKLTYALSNSMGFGGHNAIIAFKKWED